MCALRPACCSTVTDVACPLLCHGRGGVAGPSPMCKSGTIKCVEEGERQPLEHKVHACPTGTALRAALLSDVVWQSLCHCKGQDWQGWHRSLGPRFLGH